MNTSRSDALHIIAAGSLTNPWFSPAALPAGRRLPATSVPTIITPVRIAAARKRKRPGQSLSTPGCIPRPCAI